MERAMNHITVVGGSSKEREDAGHAVAFAISELMPRMRTLDIYLIIKSIEDKCDGYCLSIDNRTFEIEIQSGIPYDDFITAVFHEMVHVKQHARKELVDKGIIKKWLGEEWLNVFTTVDQYMALPWEKEAYEMQEVLFEKWNTHLESH